LQAPDKSFGIIVPLGRRQGEDEFPERRSPIVESYSFHSQWPRFRGSASRCCPELDRKGAVASISREQPSAVLAR
jgi:hypothetical protein